MVMSPLGASAAAATDGHAPRRPPDARGRGRARRRAPRRRPTRRGPWPARAAPAAPKRAASAPISTSLRSRTGARHAMAATGSRAIASARPPRVRASSVPRCSCARSRARPERGADVAAAAGGPGDADLERVLAEAHADLDAGRVVERAQQVLDDPVGRQLHAGGQHARAALDGQARGVALVAQDERAQRRERRRRRGRGVVVAQDADDRRASPRAWRGWPPRSRASVAVAAAPSPASAGRRRPAAPARPGGGPAGHRARPRGACDRWPPRGVRARRAPRAAPAVRSFELAHHAAAGVGARAPARRPRCVSGTSSATTPKPVSSAGGHADDDGQTARERPQRGRALEARGDGEDEHADDREDDAAAHDRSEQRDVHGERDGHGGQRLQRSSAPPQHAGS